MLSLQTYQPEHAVTFSFENGEVMVNATEMAKPFGKQPKDFLRTQSTQEYIMAFSGRTKCLPTDLVRVVNGGNSYGTWLHRKLALRFAQWLSPDFAIWVDEKIEELLTTGKTELRPMNQFDMMRLQIQMMEEHEQRLTKVEAKISTVNEDYYTIPGWYRISGRTWDLSLKDAQKIGKELSKASQLNGFEVLKAYDAKYGKVNTYHSKVLKSVLGF